MVCKHQHEGWVQGHSPGHCLQTDGGKLQACRNAPKTWVVSQSCGRTLCGHAQGGMVLVQKRGGSLAHAPRGPSVTASTEGRRFRRCLDEGCLGASFERLRLTAVRVSLARPPLRAPSAPWCRGCPFGRHLCDRSMDRSCMQKEPKLLFQDSKSRRFCGRSGLPDHQKRMVLCLGMHDKPIAQKIAFTPFLRTCN